MWSCDSTLQSKITGYGVALSTVSMPDAGFGTNESALYTAFAPEAFVSGQEQTSVLVNNILESGADNAARGAAKIYAAPYVILDNGSESGLVLTGQDSAPAAGGVSYSMQDILEQIDLIYPSLNDTQQESLKTLYQLDTAAMENWALYNIAAAVEGNVTKLATLCPNDIRSAQEQT